VRQPNVADRLDPNPPCTFCDVQRFSKFPIRHALVRNQQVTFGSVPSLLGKEPLFGSICATKNATVFADRLWNRDKSFRSQKLSFIRLLPIMFGKGSIGLTHSQTKSGLVLSASPLRFSSVGFRLSKLVLFRDRISRSVS